MLYTYVKMLYSCVKMLYTYVKMHKDGYSLFPTLPGILSPRSNRPDHKRPHGSGRQTSPETIQAITHIRKREHAMAAKRSIPTTLFASPDFFELSSDTVRLLLIGIILDADDEGRGCAHARLLARKLDTTTEAVEQTLKECEAHRILRCYLVEGRPYYVLLHWHKYQVLSRPTPSSYPPPPQDQPSPEVAHTETPQGTQGFPWERTDSPGESLPEEEEEENRTEQEEKRRENAEGEGLCPSVVRF